MSKEHQTKVYHNSLWASTEPDGVISYGIRKSTLDFLEKISALELPDEGTILTKGERMVLIEALKAITELESPVCGEVLQTNTSLLKNPETIISGDDSDWLIRIKPDYS